MKEIINYKVIMVLFLCAVFVCGTQLAIIEPVSAASYKKFDSGKINSDGIIIKYTSYIKGKNNVYMKLTYGKKNKALGKVYLSRVKTKIKVTYKIKGQRTQSESMRHYGMSMKTMYRYFKTGMRNAF